MVKITKKQREIFDKLSETEWKSSYDIGANLNALRQLQKKEMVKSRSGLSSMFSPRTGIEWKRKVRIIDK